MFPAFPHEPLIITRYDFPYNTSKARHNTAHFSNKCLTLIKADYVLSNTKKKLKIQSREDLVLKIFKVFLLTQILLLNIKPHIFVL